MFLPASFLHRTTVHKVCAIFIGMIHLLIINVFLFTIVFLRDAIMKSVEFRIPLPLTLSEYQIGQSWCFVEQSKRETCGEEGVRIIKDEPLESQKGTLQKKKENPQFSVFYRVFNT